MGYIKLKYACVFFIYTLLYTAGALTEDDCLACADILQDTPWRVDNFQNLKDGCKLYSCENRRYSCQIGEMMRNDEVFYRSGTPLQCKRWDGVELEILMVTPSPTATPTTPNPTNSPTPSPTKFPTISPTPSPTHSPTTPEPTASPTPSPTNFPTESPTAFPTDSPTTSPTRFPTESPTTSEPTTSPTTSSPTISPTPAPTNSPTVYAFAQGFLGGNGAATFAIFLVLCLSLFLLAVIALVVLVRKRRKRQDPPDSTGTTTSMRSHPIVPSNNSGVRYMFGNPPEQSNDSSHNEWTYGYGIPKIKQMYRTSINAMKALSLRRGPPPPLPPRSTNAKPGFGEETMEQANQKPMSGVPPGLGFSMRLTSHDTNKGRFGTHTEEEPEGSTFNSSISDQIPGRNGGFMQPTGPAQLPPFPGVYQPPLSSRRRRSDSDDSYIEV